MFAIFCREVVRSMVMIKVLLVIINKLLLDFLFEGTRTGMKLSQADKKKEYYYSTPGRLV